MIEIRKRSIRMVDNSKDASYGDLPDDPLLLAQHIITWKEPSRVQKTNCEYLRSSSIYSSCVREEYIKCRMPGARKSMYINEQLYATFAIGNAVHSWIQNSPHYFRGALFGWWKCSACGSMRFGRMQSSSCADCGANASAFRYSELELKVDKPFPGIGHVDLLLMLSPGKISICDIKTISGTAYDRLDSPLVENVYQVIDYMLLAKYATGLPVSIDTNYAYILYVPKVHQSRSFPSKAFRVGRVKQIESAIVAKRNQFARALRNNVIPDVLSDCLESDFSCSKSRNCANVDICRAECFSVQSK